MADLKRYQMLIDGEWVDSGDGKTFESINPTTGQPWAEVPEASAEDVDKAVRAAHRAFSEGPWSRTTASERGKYLRKLADLLASKSEDLGRTETVDTGKMFKETRWQAAYIADFFHFYAGLADKVHGETLPIDKPDLVRLHLARTARRDRRRGAVEFAAVPGRGQDRPGARRRQHCGAEGLRTRLRRRCSSSAG